jgi:hypothetical protein
MEKQFTINIPDELYVNSWEKNLTATFTYNGPDKVYAVIQLIKSQDDNVPDEEVFNTISTEQIDSEIFLDVEKYKIIEISANTDTALAELLYQRKNDGYSYVYQDVENFDGSTGVIISNPRITDYYTVVYSLNDEKTKYELKMLPIYKFPQQLEIVAEVDKKLELLNYNKDSVSTHTSETINKITQAIATLNSFKETIKNERPWKFDKLPDSNVIPKISKSLEMSLKPIPAPVEQPAAEQQEVPL